MSPRLSLNDLLSDSLRSNVSCCSTSICVTHPEFSLHCSCLEFFAGSRSVHFLVPNPLPGATFLFKICNPSIVVSNHCPAVTTMHSDSATFLSVSSSELHSPRNDYDVNESSDDWTSSHQRTGNTEPIRFNSVLLIVCIIRLLPVIFSVFLNPSPPTFLLFHLSNL